MKKIILLFFIFSFYHFNISANNGVKDFFYQIKTNNYSSAKIELELIENYNLKLLLIDYYNFIYNSDISFKNSTDKLKLNNESELIIYQLNIGLKEYYGKGNEILAFKTLKKAL
ncbi:hypothetical protein H9W90_04015 [Polaribacter pectinis]|uniref:Uncharacterized protein n=1 Tax=Polaribacter pectinis TaxID=2738844 RepID=A0A7G9LCE7_9FLAO|nr:hypothetical protein [Polaribacter pectinis]QNM86296.1 hypothetical protein H9W90_04015 [Polaribacter pectinis]